MQIELNDTTWLSFTEYGLGQSYFIAGRYRDAEVYLGRAIERLTAAPDDVPSGTTGSSVLVLCHMMKAMVCGWLGNFDEAERSSEQADDLARANDRPYDLIAAEYGRGVIQMMRAKLDEAEDALERALRISREGEVRLFLPLVMSALGNLYVQQGHAAQARDLLLQARDEAEALGHETSKVAVSAYLGAAYGQLGDIDTALALVRACQASARQKGYMGIEALAGLIEANIVASQGEPMAEEAAESLKRTVEIATRLEAQPLLGARHGGAS